MKIMVKKEKTYSKKGTLKQFCKTLLEKVLLLQRLVKNGFAISSSVTFPD